MNYSSGSSQPSPQRRQEHARVGYGIGQCIIAMLDDGLNTAVKISGGLSIAQLLNDQYANDFPAVTRLEFPRIGRRLLELCFADGLDEKSFGV